MERPVYAETLTEIPTIMNFKEKHLFAVKELENTKIRRANYYPPIFMLAHKIGWQLPLPHYNTFVRNAVLAGIWFGTGWGSLMYLFASNPSDSKSILLIVSGLAGLLFGLFMATYYKYSAIKNKLTPWSKIPNSQQDVAAP